MPKSPTRFPDEPKNITPEQHAAFLSALRAGHYNLLLGAGSSMDSRNAVGELPSGNTLKSELCGLKGVNQNNSLQRVFSLLQPAEITTHVTNRFIDAQPGPTAKLIGSFVWKRIFTWNIDDVLENLYKGGGGQQQLSSIHFSDPFIEAPSLAELPLVHLHGSVLAPGKGYVFSRTEYIDQVKNISHWMVVLTQLLQTEPFIISGTSLDEVDLDFYLAHRTPATSRVDRGPSILVEAPDDAITDDLCKKHNLLHFVGYSSDFLKFCADLLPSRPTPYELIPIATRKLLPAELSRAAALAFSSDFEIVPATAASESSDSRFFYGHPPSWSDLARNADVSRALTINLITDIEERLGREDLSKLVLVSENAGAGKTTVLRRAAFELAKRGKRTLFCSALSRLDRSIASTIDLIDEPLVLFIDNFADQVSPTADLLAKIEKKDIVIVGGERSYRMRYLRQVLGAFPFKIFKDLPLESNEATALLDRYIDLGVVAADGLRAGRSIFLGSLAKDAIALACCRILNDFRPLERIISDLVKATGSDDLNRYLLAALSQQCFMAGVRYEIVASALPALGLRNQFDREHPLPLAYSDAGRELVIPENATLADKVLEHVSGQDPERMLRVFTALANAVGPRVNRGTIIRRTPEARLAGRLFDYDDIVKKYLGENAEKFYSQAQAVWKWNSRYWEQVALLNLAEYQSRSNKRERSEALERAVRHARHAVSIERHPFPLSTLGKVLMVQMLEPGNNMASVYSDAFTRLKEAIDIETSRSRSSVHPYAFLFSGTVSYLEHRGVLSYQQIETLKSSILFARRAFPRDTEIQELADEATRRLAAH